jgi:hypothetical protein
MFDTTPYQPPPVESGEMSFALTLFIAAARGQVTPPNLGYPGSSSRTSHPLSNDPVLLSAREILEDEPCRLPDEVPLACAVSVLLHHYKHDVRQRAVCARLVAFYSLMARRQGDPFDVGAPESESYLSTAALSPAVVKAVATATVGEDGLFDDAEFECMVESFSPVNEPLAGLSAFPGHKQPFRRSKCGLAVTVEVRQLSVKLLAFQSCVAMESAWSTPHFRALEQLCVRIGEMSGNVTLQVMLLRAWRAALPEFPWLQSAPPLTGRLLVGLDTIQAAPTPRAAMKCEMVILGFFIELLRSLLGDVVTIQVLRSLWPLANFDADRGAFSRPIDTGQRQEPARMQ